MPTITREQIIKRQSAAPDGWNYDYKHFAIWGENQLSRTIKQDDGSLIIAEVFWRENMKTRSNKYCSWDCYAGTVSPFLNVKRWERRDPDSDVWHSFGSGKYKRLSETEYSRKNYKELCKYAAAVPDDVIMQLFSGNLQNEM